MEEKLKSSLTKLLWDELEHNRNMLKCRIQDEVNKIMANILDEWTTHMEKSLKHLVARSLDLLINDNSVVNTESDCHNHENEQINEEVANHDEGDSKNATDPVNEKKAVTQASEPKQSETQIKSLPTTDANQTDNFDDEEAGPSGLNGHSNDRLSIDDLDDNTADSEVLAAGNFEDEFLNNADMSQEDDEFDEEENYTNGDQAENYDEEDDPIDMDGMYEVPGDSNSDNGQHDNLDDTSQDSLTQNGYINRKRKIPKSMQLDSQAELVNEGSHIKFGIRCTVKTCTEVCNFKAELDQHLIMSHGINPYMCVLTDCNRSFSDISQLVIHQNVNHKDVTNWTCRDCGKENDSSQRLQQHHYTAHYKRVFRCTMADCYFSADSRRDALRHFQVYHAQVYREMKTSRSGKHFLCPYKGCGKVFTERTNLRTHKRFHTRSKPFGCSWQNCKYLSEDRANTIRHIRVRHLRLPATLKEQQEKGINNEQDPRQWLQIHNDQF